MELLLRTFFLMGLACFMLPALQKDGTTKKIVIQAGDKKISFNADYRFHCTTLKDAFEGSACSEPITCNALQNSLPLIRPFFKKGALYTCDKLKKSLKNAHLSILRSL